LHRSQRVDLGITGLQQRGFEGRRFTPALSSSRAAQAQQPTLAQLQRAAGGVQRPGQRQRKGAPPQLQQLILA
jgi:hypothetical protein